MKINVLFFIYNRPAHTAETLAALLAQKEHIGKIIFYVDRPRSEADQEQQIEVLTVVRTLMGEHPDVHYTLSRRQENVGIARSITEGTNSYCSTYTEPFVVIEDDCKPHPLFLSYMSSAFAKWESDPSVYTVCGYQYLEDASSSCEVELSSRFNPWGWGSWPSKWKFEWLSYPLPGDIVSEIPESVRQFIEDERYLNGKMDIWSTTVVITQYMRGLKTAVPTRSLVENIGFDGTGVHSETTDAFDISKEPITALVFNDFTPVIVNHQREQKIELMLRETLQSVMNKK